jgi:dextranase
MRLTKKGLFVFIASILALFTLILFFTPPPPEPGPKTKNEQNDAPIHKAEVIKELTTDKASYKPNEPVHFTAEFTEEPANGTLKIAYYHLNKVISKQEITVNSRQAAWSWQPPKEDFKGYFVQVAFESPEKKDEQTIGVDVSSDWSKFPRYGFLSKFQDMPEEEMKALISKLNRYHINGLQFYDWHYKHHQPIQFVNGAPASHWEDIANRSISLQTIRTYIQLAHERNMNTMAYNLLYGAFAEAEKDGVKTEWRLFKDQQHNAHDFHPLPDEWKSDVFLVNPAHPEWQQYVIDQQKSVYEMLPFDGWHIDQLGPRGNVYDYEGNEAIVEESFQPFLTKAKEEDPGKKLVMNAVNQYGQKQLALSPVDFLYTEVWDQFKYYSDLKRIIDENYLYSQSRNNTVLAAYMNYDLSNRPGAFNTPGILLANSVIFASGGAHLELGEHMLSKEYFPHSNLQMDESLTKQLIRYYDFLTAYENLLRDGLTDTPVHLLSSNQAKLTTEPEQGKIWTFAKEKSGQKVIHFINFTDANTMEWRDTAGIQPEPSTKKSITVEAAETKTVKEIWMATPDSRNGLPSSIDFEQEGDRVTFTIPDLKYWDMIVLEYE